MRQLWRGFQWMETHDEPWPGKEVRCASGAERHHAIKTWLDKGTITTPPLAAAIGMGVMGGTSSWPSSRPWEGRAPRLGSSFLAGCWTVIRDGHCPVSVRKGWPGIELAASPLRSPVVGQTALLTETRDNTRLLVSGWPGIISGSIACFRGLSASASPALSWAANSHWIHDPHHGAGAGHHTLHPIQAELQQEDSSRQEV